MIVNVSVALNPARARVAVGIVFTAEIASVMSRLFA